MKLSLLLILAFFLISCKPGKMTLGQLQKAKWTQLTQGIDYISTQKEKRSVSEKKSFDIKLVATEKNGLMSGLYIEKDSAFSGSFSTLLKEHHVKSKAGYLRVNLSKMLLASGLKAQIYLRGDYIKPFSFSKDSAILLSIPGIRSARFISKEDAKKKYLAEGNDDWSKILDENPLPNAIEIELENKNWTKQSLEELETIITQRIQLSSEFNYSALIIEEDKTYYFFEYKRITTSYPQ